MTVPRLVRPHFPPPDWRVLGGGGVLRRRPPAGHRLTDRDRRVLAWATRFGRLTPTQAWRWFYPAATTPKATQNRLAELTAVGLCVRVPLRRDQEGVYIPTPAGAREGRAGLRAPRVPAPGDLASLGKLGHSLTVAEAAWWLLHRPDAAPGVAWLTERELAREAVLAMPPARRGGARGIGPLPDGALRLPDGDRLAVEVELHDKAARLGDKLRWYRDQAGYAGVLWLTHRETVRRPLEEAIASASCASLMWVEPLPPECLVYVR